jgi:uncharacterized lipoprotein
MIGVVVAALASANSGCGWFKPKSNYQESVENRPLEVPPDLNLPDVSAATALPPAVGLGSGQAASGLQITLEDSATVAFPRVGKALGQIEGVVINGQAEALGSYDVTYQGQSFLIRLQDLSTGGSRIMALSPDGRILNTGPAAALTVAIKAKY